MKIYNLFKKVLFSPGKQYVFFVMFIPVFDLLSQDVDTTPALETGISESAYDTLAGPLDKPVSYEDSSHTGVSDVDTTHFLETDVSEIAYDTLAGPLDKYISYSGSPYIITSDIEVPAGKMVEVDPGTVFLFKNFTGLHVQGRLIAQGTKDKPVIFTSINDNEYSGEKDLLPNPYDWNGIYLHDDAIGTELTECKILYTVYGINSDTKFFKLKNCIFRHNGKSDLTIEGESRDLSAEPFSYTLSIKDARVDGVPVKILEDPLKRKRMFYRYSGITFFIGGLASFIYYAFEYNDSNKEFNELSSLDNNNLTTHTSSDWESAKTRRNKDLALSVSGGLLGVLGSIGIIYSFRF